MQCSDGSILSYPCIHRKLYCLPNPTYWVNICTSLGRFSTCRSYNSKNVTSGTITASWYERKNIRFFFFLVCHDCRMSMSPWTDYLLFTTILCPCLLSWRGRWWWRWWWSTCLRGTIKGNWLNHKISILDIKIGCTCNPFQQLIMQIKSAIKNKAFTIY